MRLTILLALFFFQLHLSQTYTLKVHDTLKIDKIQNNGWLEISSDKADLIVELYSKEKLLLSRNDSRGIKSVERINLNPFQQNNELYLKIYANAYLTKASDVNVTIKQLKKISSLKKEFNNTQLLDDLEYFIKIRKEANSGLYAYRSKKQIDSLHNWARKSLLNTTSIKDFFNIITTITNYEGSCHNATFLPNSLEYYLEKEEAFIPIILKNIEDELYCNTNSTPIPLGAKIISINNISARQLISRISQYYNADGFSNKSIEKLAFDKRIWETYYYAYGIPNEFKIVFEYNNQKQTIYLKPVKLAEIKKRYENRHSIQLDNKLNQEKYSFTKLQDKVYQLAVRGFDFAGTKEDINYTKFEKFLDESIDILNQHPDNKLILDLRYNTGGAGILYEKLYSYLTNRPFRDSYFGYSNFNNVPLEEQFIITPFIALNKLNTPKEVSDILKTIYPLESQGKYYISDEKNPLLLPNTKTFNGKIYLIIDEKVASAGSHLASLVKSYTSATVIGRETNGGYYQHNGHVPFMYSLPNTGILTQFSILNLTQDAANLNDQPFGSGVIPHYYVKENLDDFLNNEDTYLKETLKIIHGK